MGMVKVSTNMLGKGTMKSMKKKTNHWVLSACTPKLSSSKPASKTTADPTSSMGMF